MRNSLLILLMLFVDLKVDMMKKCLLVYPVPLREIFNPFFIQHMKQAREFVVKFEDPYCQRHCRNG